MWTKAQTYLRRRLAMQRKHMVWSIVISGLILGHGLAGRVEAGARKYYLTKDAVAGDKPVVTCQKNYHMASLWEIFNMTTLTYNTQLGRTHADSGGHIPPN